MKSIFLLIVAGVILCFNTFKYQIKVKNPLNEPDKTINIGLLIQDKNSVEARNAAELAIKRVNAKGGLNGRPLKLIVRSMDGPWGTGSKYATDMIFNDKVWAIMGSHDGRNAHLVEQVTTKVRMVFLSAWASDPTLSQAFVPSFFNCVPNDRQQANAIIQEIYNKRKIAKIAVVFDNGYDSKLAAETFVKTTKKLQKADPVMLSYDNSINNFKFLVDQIEKANVGGIVLMGQSKASKSIIKLLNQRNLKLTVFGSLSILNENSISGDELNLYENLVMISTGNNLGPKGQDFKNEYLKMNGKLPGAVASYAFDGMNMIFEAIKNCGFDREKVQNSLSKIHYEGISGLIQFDEKGNRQSGNALVVIKNGIPVELKN